MSTPVPQPEPSSAPVAQGEWEWCQACQGLFYGSYQLSSVCPAGGTHNGVRSGNYVLTVQPGTAPMTAGTIPLAQVQWKWCRKCQALFYGPGQAASKCPAGGAHDGSASGSYLVIVIPDTA